MSQHVQHYSSVDTGCSKQYGGAERFQRDLETAVKTRLSSSQSREQRPSNVQTNTSSMYRSSYLSAEDMDIDGPPAEGSLASVNQDLEVFDFRSTDGLSTNGSSSPRDSSMSTFTPEHSSSFRSSQGIHFLHFQPYSL